MPSPPPTDDTPILFRPSKKRKLYRQRDATPPPATQEPSAPAPAQSLDELIASGVHAADDEGEGGDASVNLAEILRLRKQRRPKLGGVEFRAEGPRRDTEMEEDERGGEREEDTGAGVGGRFAPQTGVVGMGDVDRHMMAYIDSKLAKRGQEEMAAKTQLPTTATSATTHTEALGEREKGKEPDAQRQPATLGRLLEIDLGDEARDKNVEMTNQARRRMDGEVIEEEHAPKGKVKLGRDGKPWRSRKRRGSEDVKRDKMVEDILRENRLDIYDELPTEPVKVSDDQAADDIIAEAFRKEFMDAVSQRQRKKAVPAQPPARGVGGKREEELKGPKLGGSRSARAAMRETLLKSQAKK